MFYLKLEVHMKKVFKRSSFLLLGLLVVFLCCSDIKAQDWNLLWSYNVSTAVGSGQYGSETDGLFLYTSFGSNNDFAKFDLDGNWIETFSINGVSGIKDLAYDGDSFYGSNSNNQIFVLDFNLKQLITTINSPINVISIAYDSENNGFWCSSWNSDVVLLNPNGTIQSTIPYLSYQVNSVCGIAYDNISEGGPFLWLHSSNFLGSLSAIVQINIATGNQTGVWHNVLSDAGLGIENPLAGGLFNSINILPGYLVIGGLIQGNPSKFFAYSLLQYTELPPSLLSPENMSYGNDVLPLFDWTSAEGAVSYQIQVSTQYNFDTIEIDILGIEDTSFQLNTQLNELTLYYWRVRGISAENENGVWSRPFSFFTEGELTQPELINPENNYEGSSVSPIFNWTGLIAASNYHIQIASSEDFSNLIIDEPLLNSPTFSGGFFEMSTQYWWRVRMYNPVDTSAWSEVWTFTTGSFVRIGNGTTYNSQYEYPSAYSNFNGGVRQQFLILPEEIYEAGGNTGEITSLAFNVADINSGVALQNYQIKIKTSTVTELAGPWDLDGFTIVYSNDSYSPFAGWNSHDFIEPFFWDGASSIIVELCFNNMSPTINESTFWTECDFTSTRFFNIDNFAGICSDEPMWSSLSNYRPNMLFEFDLPPVSPPVLENPVNKSICVSTTAFFDWTDPDGAIYYTLQVSSDPNFYYAEVDITGLEESQYQLADLNCLNEITQYYWRVNASDGENVSYWSRISNFITEGELTSPILISPAFAATEQEQAQIFTWESILGASSYHLQVALDDEFQNIICDSITSENQLFLYNLPLNTQIFWRVASQNECSVSSFSETWYFTTNNIPFAYGYNISNYGMAKGLVTFSLINPENIYLIDDQSDIENLYCGTWANNLWYAVSSGNNLVTINYLTGERTVIGNIGFEVEGMSYDVQSNTMFAICYVNGNSYLYSIDLLTAVPTQIGVVGTGYFYGLGASIEGNLYTLCDNDNSFYSVNKYTGESTLIGPTGFDIYYRQEIEFDKNTNTCYVSSSMIDSGRLLTINVATGNATIVGIFTNREQITAMAIPYFEPCLEYPQLVAPENNSFCIETTTELDWNEVENSLTYTLQLTSDPSFVYIDLEVTDIASSNYSVNNLYGLTQYYWRVMAIGEDNCNSNWSSVWSFITNGDLSQPILINPPDGSFDFVIPLTFYWEATFGAENYQLQVSLNSEFSELVINQTGITETNYLGTGLGLITEYWWRVKAINSCNESEWSYIYFFTTGSSFVTGTGTQTNVSISYPAPYGGSNGAAKHQILIRAEELSAFGAIPGVITSIAFEIAQINSGSVLTDFAIQLKSTSVNELTAAWDLSNYTTVYGPVNYYPVLGWNIHQFDENFIWDGTSNILVDVCFNNLNTVGFNESTYFTPTSFNSVRWGNTRGQATYCTSPSRSTLSMNRPNMLISMNLSGLTPPELSSPLDNSYCITTTPLLDWSDVENADAYTLQLATDNEFLNIVLETSVNFISEFQIPVEEELEETILYYWRVNAANYIDTSVWSQYFKFTTDGELPPTTLIAPQNELTNTPKTMLLSWNGLSAATGYHLQVATDEEFSDLFIDQNELTETNFYAADLAMNTQYWWRVKMYNLCSEGYWSDAWTFTTGAFVNIGDGTNYNSSWQFPAPYGNYNQAVKHHFLIRAEELIAAGMTTDAITSLAFNVAQINSGDTLENFTISLKHTNTTSLGLIWDLNNWTSVYGPYSYIPNLGWNIHEFDNAFNWDGVSNILVGVCFYNASTTVSLNESFYYTNTGYFSAMYYGGFGGSTICSSPARATISSNRPNMMFGLEIPVILPPELLLPVNTAIEVSLTPVFEWEESEYATSYTLQVSDNENFSNILIEHIITEGTTFQLTLEEQLNPLTQYFWRLNAAYEDAISLWSVVFSFTTDSGSETQNISLNSGWNIISSFIEPENADIENVFDNISTDVKIVKNGAGEMYNPAFNINTIGNWNNKDGYLVNMLNEDELNISGGKIVPEETPINLNNGWNLSAYLRDNEMSPTAALSSISSSLVLAKDNVGGIFMPSFGINTIGNMQSGQGYYFYMNEAAELTYPANSAQKAVTGNNITPLAKYNIPTIGNTGSNATLLISIENNEGNEIGVYNMNNELIGAGAIHNGIAAITIWGDDEATQNVDGAKENEYLNVKLYNTTNNTSKEISLTQIKEITGNTEQNELYYRTNAIYVAKASAYNESGFAMSIKNIPNPVENNVVFEFTLTEESNAEIQVYTSTGELIASIGNKIYSAGIHRIDFDASNLANGMYNIVLSSSERRVTSFMIVSK